VAFRVAIVGPGALGRALGALLVRHGAKVLYIGRRGPEGAGFDAIDLALVTVKAYDTKAAIAGAAWCFEGAPVVSLQNGLGNVEAIADVVHAERVLAGATTHAAIRDASGTCVHTASGETRVAPFAAGAATIELARRVAADLSAHGVSTSVEPDAKVLLWRKLAVAAGILGVTAARRITNGELLAEPAAFAEAVAATGEALEVARGLGIAVPDEAGPLLRGVCERTASNRSSMLQDIEAGRRTESDAIHGAVVRAARKLKRDAPHARALQAKLAQSSTVRVTTFIPDENPTNA
jgi:2-dehydropantoate 2-reductase